MAVIAKGVEVDIVKRPVGKAVEYGVEHPLAYRRQLVASQFVPETESVTKVVQLPTEPVFETW